MIDLDAMKAAAEKEETARNKYCHRIETALTVSGRIDRKNADSKRTIAESIQLTEAAAEYYSIRSEYRAMRKAFRKDLQRIPDPVQRLALYFRYALNHTILQIVNEIGYELSQTKRLLKEAAEAYQHIPPTTPLV